MIGNGDPIASLPGEIVLAAGEAGWYDYEAKYTPGGMRLVVPARVPDRVRDRIQEVAIEAFRRTECSGLARVDFFVEGERVLLNELNTMPGFTSTSVFAALFEASGVPYAELLDRLVALAFERHAAESRQRVHHMLPRMSTEIESVAVVGAGFMGTGIAEVAAVAGLPVIVRDVDDASLARAGERIETSLARAVRGGKIDEESAREARGADRADDRAAGDRSGRPGGRGRARGRAVEARGDGRDRRRGGPGGGRGVEHLLDPDRRARPGDAASRAACSACTSSPRCR